jgi:hypothetical protein
MTTVIHSTRAAIDTAVMVAPTVTVTATKFGQRSVDGRLS